MCQSPESSLENLIDKGIIIYRTHVICETTSTSSHVQVCACIIKLFSSSFFAVSSHYLEVSYHNAAAYAG